MIYVAPNGNDSWSGLLPEPNTARTDGPKATPVAAQAAARRTASGGGGSAATVVIRGGVYYLTEPLVFGPEDSNTKWISAPGENVVISGGRKITGFRSATFNNVSCWAANLPEVKTGKWAFVQLWVNGERRFRPRYPSEGELQPESLPGVDYSKNDFMTPTPAFVARPSDAAAFSDFSDVEVVYYEFWVSGREVVKSFDPATRLVTLSRPTQMQFSYDTKAEPGHYWLDNVPSEFKSPGQWYLDRRAGVLYYMPVAGERMDSAQVVAPYLEQVVRVEGGADKPVQSLSFEKLTFSHNEWRSPENAEQAARKSPGAVALRHARNVKFEGCRIEHAGTYGLDMAEDVSDCSISRCALIDIGAGGVKIWHGCDCNTVSDCEIADGGKIQASGVGVLIGNASGVKVIHNDIHDFYYTGVSVGWTWGYAPSHTFGNIVEWNHIHDIGKGRLSDMGGIYTLGRQPGTRLRYNLIRNVDARLYCGCGIYTDEGSSDILIENNIICRANVTGYNHHYGSDNLVRNNIFAFCKEVTASRGRAENQVSFIFENNIVYYTEGEAQGAPSWDPSNVVFRSNLFWNPSGPAVFWKQRTFAQWQALGFDKDSIVADPLFVDATRADFRLTPGSPAEKIGFVPFDLSGVGPRR